MEIATYVFGPTQLVDLGITCVKGADGIFAPRASFRFMVISGRHSYVYVNGALIPEDTERQTREYEAFYPADSKPSVRSFDLVLGDAQEFTLERPTPDYAFEYLPTDCLDEKGQPVTDLNKVRAGECANASATTPIVAAWREDIVSKTKDANGPELTRVRYQARPLHVVATLGDDADPTKASVFVARLVLLEAAKSGNPVIGKDLFNATVDGLVDKGFAPDWAKNRPDAGYMYFGTSQALRDRYEATIEDRKLETSYKSSSEERIRNSVGYELGWTNDFAPTNRPATWHGLPWPASTPITFETKVSPNSTVPMILTRNPAEGRPSGRLPAVLEELSQRGSALAVKPLRADELKNNAKGGS